MDYQQKIFGKLLEKTRKEKGLTKKDLVIKLGYTNITKGIRRIDSIEDGDMIEPIVSNVMEILEVTQEERANCEKQMAEKVREWIDSLPPLKPYLVVRVIPGIYAGEEIPQDLSEKEMVDYAVNYAKENRKRGCLNYAHEKRYWIKPDGSYFVDKEFGGGPVMRLKKG